MGKTSLALAVLHHADVEQKYPERHFVSCESANGAGELISIVGSYLQLPQSKGLSKAIYGYFLDHDPAILVLDNIETPWEPPSDRTQVEEFLSLLARIPHLALLVSINRFASCTTGTLNRSLCVAQSVQGECDGAAPSWLRSNPFQT
jgi:hypothetical protein